MSLMIDGELRDGWLESETENGEFVRRESRFRNWVTVDGAPGPSGEGGFAAAPGRYHLYVSLACPWAHRIADHRNLSRFVRELYGHPGIAETVNMDHIKQHYYTSHDSLNPTRIVPKGPALDFLARQEPARVNRRPQEARLV